MTSNYSQPMPGDSYHDPQYYTRRSLPLYNDNQFSDEFLNTTDYDANEYQPPVQNSANHTNGVEDASRSAPNQSQKDQPISTQYEVEDLYLNPFLTTEDPKQDSDELVAAGNDTRQINKIKQRNDKSTMLQDYDTTIDDQSEKEFQLISLGSDSYTRTSIRKRKDDATETTFEGNESTLFDDKRTSSGKYNYFSSDEVFRDDDIADLNKDSIRRYEEELDKKKSDRPSCWTRFKNTVNGISSRGPIVRNSKAQFHIQ
jgi:hypothetical protein